MTDLRRALGAITLCCAFGAGCADMGAVDEETIGLVQSELRVRHHDSGELIGATTRAKSRAYQRLAKGWLRWVFSQPWSTGPVNDPTGAQCGNEQSGGVWYLAGTPGGPATRECTIPSHTPLFMPLDNVWVLPSQEEIDGAGGLDVITPQVAAYFESLRGDACAISLRVDGVEQVTDLTMADEQLWTAVPRPFPVYHDADNFSGRSEGVYPAYTAGHFALLAPLTPGDHTVELSASLCYMGSVYFQTSVDWTLHVTP